MRKQKISTRTLPSDIQLNAQHSVGSSPLSQLGGVSFASLSQDEASLFKEHIIALHGLLMKTCNISSVAGGLGYDLDMEKHHADPLNWILSVRDRAPQEVDSENLQPTVALDSAQLEQSFNSFGELPFIHMLMRCFCSVLKSEKQESFLLFPILKCSDDEEGKSDDCINGSVLPQDMSSVDHILVPIYMEDGDEKSLYMVFGSRVLNKATGTRDVVFFLKSVCFECPSSESSTRADVEDIIKKSIYECWCGSSGGKSGDPTDRVQIMEGLPFYLRDSLLDEEDDNESSFYIRAALFFMNDQLQQQVNDKSRQSGCMYLQQLIKFICEKSDGMHCVVKCGIVMLSIIQHCYERSSDIGSFDISFCCPTVSDKNEEFEDTESTIAYDNFLEFIEPTRSLSCKCLCIASLILFTRISHCFFFCSIFIYFKWRQSNCQYCR